VHAAAAAAAADPQPATQLSIYKSLALCKY